MRLAPQSAARVAVTRVAGPGAPHPTAPVPAPVIPALPPAPVPPCSRRGGGDWGTRWERQVRRFGSPTPDPPGRSPRGRAGARRRGRGCRRWRGASSIGACCIRRGAPPRCRLGLSPGGRGNSGPGGAPQDAADRPSTAADHLHDGRGEWCGAGSGGREPPHPVRGCAVPCPGENGGGCSSACRATMGRARRSGGKGNFSGFDPYYLCRGFSKARTGTGMSAGLGRGLGLRAEAASCPAGSQPSSGMLRLAGMRLEAAGSGHQRCRDNPR